MAADPDDIGALRAALRARGGAGGPTAWRSLEDLAGTPAFRRFLKAEYPGVANVAGPGSTLLGSPIDRRRFFRVMAASLALAGLAGCDDDSDTDGRTEEIPYVRDPAHIIASTNTRYATATLTDGFANGVHVVTRNGRPHKIESNTEHPWTRGGTDVLGQASILGLYDPFRSQTVLRSGRPTDWDTFRAMMLAPIAVARARQGDGLRLLTGPITSPSLAAQIARFHTELPGLHWHSHEPISRAPIRDGSQQAFGRSLETRWRFDKAHVVVALDGDFLDPGPQQVGASRDWIEARRASARSATLLTLHSFSPTPSLTSAKADYHAPMSAREIASLADCLATGQAWTGPASAAVQQAIAALEGARGQGIVHVGVSQPASVHAAVHRANARLGNLGASVLQTESPVAAAEDVASLLAAMQAGQVQTLVMIGTNPLYDMPADLDFAARLEHVPLKIHAGDYADETAESCDWHLPLAHPLEAWGDARAFDGTVSLMQPTIAPFYEGRSPQEILSLLTDPEPQSGQALLKAYWGTQWGDATDNRWHLSLRRGFVADSAFAPVPVSLIRASTSPVAAPDAAGLELLFRPDPSIRDGASINANNAWLQELPKPLSKIVWENVVAISPRLAQREGLGNGDLVTLEAGGHRIEAPVWITPGQAENTLTMTLGYGRRTADMLATNLGYDAYALQRGATPWGRDDATLRRTGRRAQIATTQDHSSMEGHEFVRMQQPGARQNDEASLKPATLYASGGVEKPGDGRAWGMVIDLDSCIGCNACVVACQSENNIAVVGKDQVMQGREMHWLRIDRYYEGDLDAPDTRFQPVPCMHCEDAPCEVGCPVEATLHDHEGLNLMVYNRCVGTRACSGYCPYKVRHFNYLDYSAGAKPSIQAGRNPDVTVRAIGVMEKCTYCVQRIAEARIDSDKSGQPIADGVVQTACQTSCPTRAISFGNLEDPTAQVTAQRRDDRNYALLGELGVKPRTTYLAGLLPPATTQPATDGKS
ncbi:TAT-variant-translocated molybdopterin oxidoreductase [Lichenicola cladoniae]|uniref:TAT-variant-translocated molybdopterin oxidoreductase n=1 Tax=Lichenicola cladoniae TaxID=1484109 RepID=A0A6M8HUD4_9PROT|nr:TAT-variant-translocated molybdopterin oxidoreductase [Lichenicola cladoniae]NPD69501.1 TAT-variant-translocated molybdopterin oxidoreductase [Acetobacteraceae bacterium]QKE92133.1 TAT-variant-translocated molybdopterin oxidoreductase [Lichenicola cladoniae]